MKNLYIAFLLALVVVFGGLIIYLAKEPRATVLMPVQPSKSLSGISEKLSEALHDHLKEAPVLMLGVIEPYAESVKLWQSLLESTTETETVSRVGADSRAEAANARAEAANARAAGSRAAADSDAPSLEATEVVLPDFLEGQLQSLKWPRSLAPVFLSAREVLARAKAQMIQGKRVIIVLPSNMTSRLGDRQQTVQLQDVLGIEVTAISIVPLAVSREGLSQLPKCNKELTPSAIVSDLSCASQYRSRFILNKHFPKEEHAGGLEQVAPSELLLYYHFPSTSGVGAMGTSS